MVEPLYTHCTHLTCAQCERVDFEAVKHTHTHAFTHARMHTYTHTHTHTHTQTEWEGSDHLLHKEDSKPDSKRSSLSPEVNKMSPLDLCVGEY